MLLWGILLVALVALLAVALTLWGWRGKRIGDHPICRRCGFDLYGLPSDAPTCPECGTDLQQRPPHIGERHRRRAPLIAGLVLLLIVGAIVAIGAVGRMNRQTLYAYAPNRYLVWVVDDPDARQELLQRIHAGNVSTATTRAAAEAALQVQGDPNKPWEESWGELIELAWSLGSLTPSQLNRYARQISGSVVLQARPRVQMGQKPAVYLDVDSSVRRAGPDTKLTLLLYGRTLRIDEQTITLPERSGPGSESTKYEITKSGWGGSMSHLLREPLDRPLGQVRLVVAYDLKRSIELPGSSLSHDGPEASGQADTTVEVVADPTGNYVQNTMPLDDRAAAARAWLDRDKDGKRHLVFVVDNQSERMDVSGWLIINRELVSLRYAMDRGSSGSDIGSAPNRYHEKVDWEIERLLRKASDPEHVAVVVRPDFERAETDVRSEPIWLGEWRFAEMSTDAPPRGDRPWDAPPDDVTTATAHPLTIEQAHQPPPAEPE